MKNYNAFVAGVTAILLMVSFVSVHLPVYAQEDIFRYELVFLTTWNSCSERNWDAMWYYGSVTKQYLKLNGLSGQGTVDCLTRDNFYENLWAGEYKTKDLVIVIPDFWYSQEYIKTTNWLGQHSYYPNNKHIIISNSLAIFNENKEATWTLSHELMHFVIAYKNYGWNYHEDYVHKIDGLYDTVCKDQLSKCPHIFDTIRAPSGKYIPVMKPMPEPSEPNEKQSSSIDVAVNGRGLIQITNGEDSVCYTVKLSDSRGNPISDVNIDLHKKYYTEDKSYSYHRSVTTNSYGKYTECQEPFRFGTTDNIIIHVLAEFDGNNQFESNTSDLATVLVHTPWKNLNIE